MPGKTSDLLSNTPSIAAQFDDTMADSQENPDPRVTVQDLLDRVKKDVTSIVQFTQTHRDPTFERHLAEQWEKIQAMVHQLQSPQRQRVTKEVEERADALVPEPLHDLGLAHYSASTPSSSPASLLGRLSAMHEILRRLREETQLELQVLSLRNAYSRENRTPLFLGWGDRVGARTSSSGREGGSSARCH